MEGDRFVHLVTLGDVSRARVWAARLESEGIDTRVHGESFGPYPVTVGALAETQIWVMESRLDDARAVLDLANADDVLGEVERGPVPAPEGTARLLALVLAVLIVSAVARALLWLF